MVENALTPERIVDRLTQCLYQSKRPLGLLLGAGCPASIRVDSGAGNQEPLIPDIAGLTDRVNAALTSSCEHYEAVVSRLEADLGRSPNIEETLSHIRGIAAIIGKHKIHDMDASTISALENEVTNQITIMMDVSLPNDDTPYDKLVLWAQAVATSIPIRIFTTNYDLLLEVALERNSVPFFDGFIGAKNPFLDTDAIESDDLPVRWIRVLKLHGSSNWTILPDHRVIRRPASDSEGRILIHPSHMKYTESRRMPYLVMQDQLRNFFRLSSATLITVGYSFSDEHINDLIAQGVRSNPNAKVFGLLYDDLADYDRAQGLARSQRSITLIASDGVIDAGHETTWQAADNPPTTTKHLGDFQNFGAHLERLVGRTDPSLHLISQSAETPDVE